MGFAILCLFSVYGIGTLILTVVEAFLYRKRCRGCQLTLHAKITGGDCCEWTVRQLLHESKAGPLPIGKLVFHVPDSESAQIISRLAKDYAEILIEEHPYAMRTDYRHGDRNCFFQSRKRVYGLRNGHSGK